MKRRIESQAWSPLYFFPQVSRGDVAQLGERLTGSQEVDGSIPFISTIKSIEGQRFTQVNRWLFLFHNVQGI